jgi:FkbM family methyltransferase
MSRVGGALRCLRGRITVCIMSLAGLVQKIGDLPLLGGAMRGLARRYREGSVVTIRTGLAKGALWRRHHRYVNGYWIGHYELEIQDALRRELKPGDTFYDVGANAGFFTLVASRLVGPTGKCVAFDPSPDNIASIREQIELNDLQSHCTAVQQAVAGDEGEADFAFATPGSPQGHLGGSKQGEATIRVQLTTLDAAAKWHGMPSFVKVDIEGAEVDALRGAPGVIAAGPTWLIELHGPNAAQGVARILGEAGYAFYALNGSAILEGAGLPEHVLALRRPHG